MFVHVHVKWCWWHTARDNLLIIKSILFYEQLLGMRCCGFFLIKSKNSMHGLFHNCSFYAQTVSYFMYWYMPGKCHEYVSSFDDCIPLETLS